MVDRLKRALSSDKVEILLPTVAASTRTRYRDGRTAWREFCSGLEISPKLDPMIPEWGASLLDFSTWGNKIMGVGYSGLLTRCAEIRFVHLLGVVTLEKPHSGWGFF